MKRKYIGYGIFFLLLNGCYLLEESVNVANVANGANLAPDAVTRATQGYNDYEGEIGHLVDGLYPGNGPGKPFIWPGKGDLTFQFEQLHLVAGLRLFVGADGGIYEVTAYQGAYLDEDGQTEAGQARVVGGAVNFELVENAWVELKFEEPVEADYLELATESSAIFYEVEILPSSD
ncbi:MAG: hypothetical protein HOC74_42270 [Gemmatimonadetes bacterium]|jgi:hypothetical protein|nr:hypothetical protein [Gemmatimonadota bacterium]